MDCREAQLLISVLQDGETADGPAVAEALEHAASCGACSAFRAGLVALAAGGPAAPAGLADRIIGVLREQRAQSAEADAAAAAGNAAAAGASGTAASDAGPTGASAGAGLTATAGSTDPSVPGLTAAAGVTAASAVPAASRGKVPLTGKASALVASVKAADANVEVPPWLTRTRLWMVTGGVAFTAVAALFAVVLFQIATGGFAPGATAPQEVSAPADSTARPQSNAPAATSKAPSGSEQAASAPPFISFRGLVYKPAEEQAAIPSELASAGTITSALDGSGQTGPFTVLTSTGEARTIFLVLASGERRRYSAVVRKYRSLDFQLQTSDTLERYGQWPRLPAELAEPTARDGSPTFTGAGIDPLGVHMYTRPGDQAENGFAIPPGTSASDPAAGNPYWTWWTPAP